MVKKDSLEQVVKDGIKYTPSKTEIPSGELKAYIIGDMLMALL